MRSLSIVIPCHNCADSIYESWMSVKNQTLSRDEWECILVDDASTDEGRTWEALCAIEQEAPENVKLIHLEENLRQGGARNVGISYAEGKYLLFLDADDRWEPYACSRVLQVASETGADLIQFNHIVHCGQQSLVRENTRVFEQVEISAPEDRIPFLNATKVTYGCWNKLYSLDLIREAQALFPEHVVYEEPLFVYPCFLYARKVVLLPEALYIYEIHPDSTVTSAIGTHLLDHPNVQLQLLEYCLKRPELYRMYRDVIALYFLWSYYCETLCFAGQRRDAFLPLAYFQGMQEICRKLFPDWRENPLMKTVSKNVWDALETINAEYGTQQELQELIGKCRETL